ncbi:uncharacterized protein K02A2.6-like [Bactrocera tryoni]|uniref:uncharacterized protein K02A2.6-like n=1 Tax=Bactrocera tryoni TaxID=59916 RepID=UPI001A96A53D|nr:uncharacterized protein K02A2.6-like [Bactrocera tryoni]
MAAPTIAKALIANWIARFGVPAVITSDRGRQFTSTLFAELTTSLGITHLKTTPYHPQANAIVERWHRTLKAAILCINSERWTDFLPTILLGLRTVYKQDLGASPAELIYDTTLRISSEFFVHDSRIKTQSEFVTQLRVLMNTTRPSTTSWSKESICASRSCDVRKRFRQKLFSAPISFKTIRRTL